MAKHEKKPRCGEFNVAAKPLCLFGCVHGHVRAPFQVPAGAWYGRDARGYWMFFNPFREYRDMPHYTVWRYSAYLEKWYREVEVNTKCARIIREKLNAPGIASEDMTRRLLMDKDDIKGLSKIPLSEKKYVNPRSMNKAYRHDVSIRERESMKVRMHPAEAFYTPLDYGNPMKDIKKA